jgi:hypothetical protein
MQRDKPLLSFVTNYVTIRLYLQWSDGHQLLLCRRMRRRRSSPLEILRPACDQTRRQAQHAARAAAFSPGSGRWPRRGVASGRSRPFVQREQVAAAGPRAVPRLDQAERAQDRRVAIWKACALEQMDPGEGANARDDERIAVASLAPAGVGGNGPRMRRERPQAAGATPADELRPRGQRGSTAQDDCPAARISRAG